MAVPAPSAGTSVSAVDIVSVVIAGLAMLTSVVSGIALGRRARASEALAREALHDARESAKQALWSAAIDAVHGMIADPTITPMAERFTTLRARSTALVDGLPDWIGFDEWLAAEHSLGAALGRQVMSRAKPDATAEEHVATAKPYMNWGMALLNNLRHFRAIGYSHADVVDLRDHAWATIREVYSRNGWGEPNVDREGLSTRPSAR